MKYEIESPPQFPKYAISSFTLRSKKSTAAFIALLLGFTTIASMPLGNAANVGSSCKKKGGFNLNRNQILICKVSNGKLTWQRANKTEMLAYQKSENEKLEKSRKVVLDSLLLGTTGDEFQEIPENSPMFRLNERGSWNEALSRFKLVLDESRKGIASQLEEVQKMQSLSSQKTQELQSAQSSKSSIDSQLRFAENDLISLKIAYDAASQSYLAAKSVSDSLYYQYQRAQNENAAILANRVLCDFGFVAGSSCTWGNYNYNASIISQYNIAISRTNSLAGSYSNTYSAYANGLSRVASLRNQSASLGTSISSITNQINLTQRDISAKQADITKAKENVSTLEIKETTLSQSTKLVDELVASLNSLAESHRFSLQAFLKKIEEINAAIDGKPLFEFEKKEWEVLVSDLRETRTKVTNSFYELLRTSTSLSLELTKAVNATK
jgi:chromosome segregation ATPase